MYNYVVLINCLYRGVSRLTSNEHILTGSTDAIFIKLKSLTKDDIKVFSQTESGDWKLQGRLKAGLILKSLSNLV